MGRRRRIPFFYSAPVEPVTVRVHDGFDGTGTILQSLALPATANFGCRMFSSSRYCPFVPIEVPFSGTAQSLSFIGGFGFLVVDDVAFLSSDVGAIPLPSTLPLLLGGRASLALLRRRRTTG